MIVERIDDSGWNLTQDGADLALGVSLDTAIVLAEAASAKLAALGEAHPPTPLTITMPVELSRGMLYAVKTHPTTKAADTEEAHRRLGWLLDAWEVMVEYQKREGVR